VPSVVVRAYSFKVGYNDAMGFIVSAVSAAYSRLKMAFSTY
jgi:hypothetical protein